MSVQFILGRSGSGKTKYCIDSLIKELLDKDDARPLVLLVPEQATYQAERAVLSHPQIAGFYSPRPFADEAKKNRPGLHILSFDRLQFLLLGKNTAKTRLSTIGRQMIIHRILTENRDNLQLFGRSAVSPGLSQKIAEAVIELHQYAENHQDIEQLIARLKQKQDTSLSSIKFADLTFVLQEYLRFIEAGLVDPDTQLGLARAAVRQCSFLKEARLWVDGFAGFTTSELSLLAELLKNASQSHIALCLDAENIKLNKPDSHSTCYTDLFYPTERTYTELLDIIKNYKLKLAKPVILKDVPRFSRCPALRHLEQNIFRRASQTQKNAFGKPRQNNSRITARDNIQIVSLPNARSEVRFVARQICRLVRQNGLRYRNIAVIASDLKLYEHYIRAVFEDYRLPFFIDRRQSLRHHPAVCLLISALRSAVSGFSTADIIACLKTGFLRISDYDTDMLENYCIAFAVRPDDWAGADDWDFDDRDLPAFDQGRINQIRRKAVEPLLKLRSGLCEADGALRKLTAEQFTKIVFEFLESCRLREQLNVLAESAAAQRDYAAADEHHQVYDRIVDTFDELCEAFTGTELGVDEFFLIIQDALSRVSLALIPPSLDQIIVGSIERSRHPDLKAVFLIGTTQKQFPAPLNYECVLTDHDRLAAQSAGFQLAPATERQLSERRYLSYIAFTRPSQHLFISYPAVDERGRQICRSQFVEDIEMLFDELREQTPASEEIDSLGSRIDTVADEALTKNGSGIFTADELTDLLCLQAEKNEHIQSLIDCLYHDKQLSELASLVRSAISYSNVAELRKGIVAKLFTNQLHSSATALQTFAACPYKYFARFVLELKKRMEFKLEPIDLGIFYHRCLNAFFTRIKKEKIDINSIKEDRLKIILEKAIADCVDSSSFLKGFCRHSSHNVAIITSACQNLQDFVPAHIQMIRAGVFRPAFTELSFGKNDCLLGNFTLKLKNGRTLFISGKIDRIDLANTDSKKLAIVLDYKTKDWSFNWQRFFSSLDIQLPLYMLAVRNSQQKTFQNTEVAGAFYIPIEAQPKSADLGEIEKKSQSFNYKAKGIFNGEYYKTLDGNVESGWSRYYKFFISKEKQQYGFYDKSSDALTAEDFENVLEFTKNKITGLAQQILTGDIRVRPYRLGTTSACHFCEFKPLCRFDWLINDYNFLPAVSKTDVLEKAKQING
jgi:ATP-dependent helicase/nuclease subunit B